MESAMGAGHVVEHRVVSQPCYQQFGHVHVIFLLEFFPRIRRGNGCCFCVFPFLRFKDWEIEGHGNKKG